MNISEALKTLESKFKSGNDIQVERATITREEYDAIRWYFTCHNIHDHMQGRIDRTQFYASYPPKKCTKCGGEYDVLDMANDWSCPECYNKHIDFIKNIDFPLLAPI